MKLSADADSDAQKKKEGAERIEGLRPTEIKIVGPDPRRERGTFEGRYLLVRCKVQEISERAALQKRLSGSRC